MMGVGYERNKGLEDIFNLVINSIGSCVCFVNVHGCSKD